MNDPVENPSRLASRTASLSRAADLFDRAIEIEAAAERDKFLARVCADDPELRSEVDRLVENHFRAGLFLEKPLPHDGTLPTDWFQQKDQIGPYKIREKIGEGGMGVVYVAEQQRPVKRKVALKVIKPGMDSKEIIARFEAERQALAVMDHPHIARVFDAGITEAGRPYFVMELVAGVPITDYCDQKKLSTVDRLQLFRDVCAAVQHAHQKGIIHRDIKPSNLLVTQIDGKPVAKVIDFGLAKATDGNRIGDKTVYTGFMKLMGTPAYMSPEQVGISGVDVDTRSDVYSLGIVLYELLTGRTPLDKSSLVSLPYEEVCRQIREVEVPKPSEHISTLKNADLSTLAKARSVEPHQLQNQVRGDLDWVVLKAVDKDRNRRYETANALNADVESYLKQEPVTAIAPSPWYVLRKYAQRNKAKFGAIVSIACLLLVASIASLWVAARERDNAERITAALAIAETSRQQAENSRKDAEAKEQQARAKEREAVREKNKKETILKEKEAILEEQSRWTYARTMNLVQAAAENRDFNRAEGLLAEADEDLRGFEWYFWQRELHRESSFLLRRGKIAFDGERIATDADGLQVRNLLHADDVTEPLRFHYEIWNLAFIPQSEQLLALAPSFALIYDIREGKLQLNKQIEHKATNAVATVSSDGKRLAIVGDSKEGETKVLSIWNLATGEQIQSISLPFCGRFREIAFFPDGRRIAVNLSSKPSGYVADLDTDTIVIVSLDSGDIESSFRSYGGMAISPDGRRLARVVPDSYGVSTTVVTGRPTTATSCVEVLDLESRALLFRLRSRDDPQRMAFSPNGKYLVTTQEFDAAKVWDASSGREIGHLTAGINQLAFSADSKLATSGDEIRIWDLDELEEKRFGVGPTVFFASDWNRAVWAPDNVRVVVGSHAAVEVWNTATKELEFSLLHEGDAHPESYTGMSGGLDWSKSGSLIAVGVQSHKEGRHMIRIWDADKRREIRELLDLRDIPFGTQSIRFSPDGHWLAAGYQDQIVLWDTATWTKRVLVAGEFSAPMIAFSPDSKELAAAADGSVRFVDVESGQERHRLQLEHFMQSWVGVPTLFGVEYSPDERHLAIAAWGGVCILERESNEVILQIREAGQVKNLSYSADGSRLLLGGSQKEVLIVDPFNGAELLRLPLPAAGITQSRACFSPNGKKIFAGCNGKNSAIVWTIASPWEVQERHSRREEYRQRDEFVATQRRLGRIDKWLVLSIPNSDDASPRVAVAQSLLDDEPNIRPQPGDMANVGSKRLPWNAIETSKSRHLSLPDPDGRDNFRGTSYAVSYLVCDHARENVLLRLGMSHYGKLFLNGKEIAKRDAGPFGNRWHSGAPHTVTLQKGLNVIVGKVISAYDNQWQSGISVSLTDKDGNALEGIRVTHTPPDSVP